MRMMQGGQNHSCHWWPNAKELDGPILLLCMGSIHPKKRWRKWDPTEMTGEQILVAVVCHDKSQCHCQTWQPQCY